jgi:pSer/pThr/pTyr-binding forkhead associated (FHA) protein
MNKKIIIFSFAVFFLVGLFATDALAAQEWISDILANPSRYWNRNVTVVGDVQAVVANPPGTTRGTYSLLDDSGVVPLTIQTKDLPPIGKTFQVTGVIVQDPNNANAPLMKESKRTSPGLASNMKILLIAGGALFLILLIIFIILLTKPKTPRAPQATVSPAPRPVPPPPAQGPAPDKTTKIPTTKTVPPPPTPDKTQVFLSLGVEIIIEKGPDQGKEFALHKQVTMFGRSGARKNEIELKDDTVSKEQCSVYYDSVNKQFTIKNESQTNVTQLNGQLITDPVTLNNGDLIEMGKTVLKFKKE